MSHNKKVSDAVKEMLTAIGEDVNRPGLIDTPERVARAWSEMTKGNKEFPDKVQTFPSEFKGVIFRPSIPFSSICEHHLLPYIGTIDFAYIPSGQVIGISKIIRLFRHYTSKLSIQEDITDLLLSKFNELVAPKGSAIRLSALHSCEGTRGVMQNGVPTVTMGFTGVFEEDKFLTEQFLQLLNNSK